MLCALNLISKNASHIQTRSGPIEFGYAPRFYFAKTSKEQLPGSAVCFIMCKRLTKKKKFHAYEDMYLKWLLCGLHTDI